MAYPFGCQLFLGMSGTESSQDLLDCTASNFRVLTKPPARRRAPWQSGDGGTEARTEAGTPDMDPKGPKPESLASLCTRLALIFDGAWIRGL